MSEAQQLIQDLETESGESISREGLARLILDTRAEAEGYRIDRNRIAAKLGRLQCTLDIMRESGQS